MRLVQWNWEQICSPYFENYVENLEKVQRNHSRYRNNSRSVCKKPRRVEYFKELKLCFTKKKIEIGTVNLMKEKVLHIYKPNDLAEKARTRTKSCIVDTREILVTEHLFLRDCEKTLMLTISGHSRWLFLLSARIKSFWKIHLSRTGL